MFFAKKRKEIINEIKKLKHSLFSEVVDPDKKEKAAITRHALETILEKRNYISIYETQNVSASF